MYNFIKEELLCLKILVLTGAIIAVKKIAVLEQVAMAAFLKH